MNIGVAEVDYTPPVGLPLMGNLRKDYASKGVHDPLYAKAIVFEDKHGTRIALLTVDVCMLSREQVALMRSYVAANCDIPAHHIFIAATHIHSGPSTMNIYIMPKADDDQIKAFLEKAAQAIIAANNNLKECEIRVGYSIEDRVNLCRRLLCKDGRVHMNWELPDPDFVERPASETDPQVIAMSIMENGKPVGAMVNTAIHPAILDYENDLYSADAPGYMAEAMRKIQSEDFKTLFFNGCAGNTNFLDYRDPASTRRGYYVAQRVGYLLAVAAKQAMNSGVPAQGDEIAVSHQLVPLTRMQISEDKYKWSLEAREGMKTNPPAGQEDGLPEEYCAETWIQMHELQDNDDEVEVMAVRIGDIAIVGLPGEVFSEFGREIKDKSPAQHTFVIELANDAIGYLPTPESFDLGGYEVTPGATRYNRNAGQTLVAAALDQLDKLFTKNLT